MRVVLLVLMSITVATVPVVPAMMCVQAPANAGQAESPKDSCCCCAAAATCDCAGCREDEANSDHSAPSAGQACLCGQETPQPHEVSQNGPVVRTEVRLATCAGGVRESSLQKRVRTRRVQIPRNLAPPGLQPPLLI